MHAAGTPYGSSKFDARTLALLNRLAEGNRATGARPSTANGRGGAAVGQSQSLALVSNGLPTANAGLQAKHRNPPLIGSAPLAAAAG